MDRFYVARRSGRVSQRLGGAPLCGAIPNTRDGMNPISSLRAARRFLERIFPECLTRLDS